MEGFQRGREDSESLDAHADVSASRENRTSQKQSSIIPHATQRPVEEDLSVRLERWNTGRKENDVYETPDSIKVTVQRPFNPAFLGICIPLLV
jgi:hypothetical protein